MGMHYAKITHRGEQDGHGQIKTQHTSSQIAVCDCNCVPWPKRDTIEGSTVFLHCDLAVGTPIDVVENNPGYTSTRQITQIVDI
jgi:hypothetical protein